MTSIKNSIELNSHKKTLSKKKRDFNLNLHFNSSKRMIKLIEILFNLEKQLCRKKVQGKRHFVKEDSIII